MSYNGKLIVIAYPDTFVRTTNEFLCRFLPLMGLGTREYIKAGHAAQILIENETGIARYFDFGRYITPNGFGRVRGANTDAELVIPFKAEISPKGKLENLNDFLLWLDANPHKTHGSGRLLASVCDSVDFDKAEKYIFKFQAQGSIEYGAFNNNGSNCARFVTDTLLFSSEEKKIQKRLIKNNRFTPSTVGNVEVSASDSKVYEVKNGKISIFMGSAFKENLVNYFDRTSKIQPEEDFTKLKDLQQSDAQILTGIGSDAWFQIIPTILQENYFRIKRYDAYGNMDFDGIYHSSEKFVLSDAFEFTYESHCAHCHVIQNQKKIKLTFAEPFGEFSSSQKLR